MSPFRECRHRAVVYELFAVSGTASALRHRSKTKGLGDIPNKQNQSCFSGQENGLIFGLWTSIGSACDKGTDPGGVCASSDRHRAVCLELITPYRRIVLLPLGMDLKNKKLP